MRAKALITRADETFSIEDVEIPEVGSDEIGIRVHFSGVSIGTEFALIRKKIKWAEFPICTGYMASGVVDRVGADIDNFKIGDRVFVRGNPSMSLLDGTSVGCTQGGHASYVVRKPNNVEGCGKIPETVDMAAASMYVMPAVALNGLSQAQPEAPETVLVYGVGLIGLGAVSLASLRGCEVIAVDVNDTALAIAAELGADHMINASLPEWESRVRSIVPDGADCVIEATGIPSCVDAAIELCRSRGKFVWQGNYGETPIQYRFLPAHRKQITAYYPCHDGQLPFRKRVIRLMEMGVIQWHKTITHREPWKNAPEIFRRINRGDNSIVGVVIDWS